MINIKLCHPFYMENQLQAIADLFKANGIDHDVDFVRNIANGCNIVRSADSITSIGDDTKATYNVITDEIRQPDENECYIGAQAVLYLLSLAGITVNKRLEPVRTIEIPSDVFHEASKTEWYDICTLAARTEQRSRRLARMTELDAPIIIIGNEYRITYETVNTLNCNGYSGTNPIERDNGSAMRSLSDVGYDLASGWNKAMLDYINGEDDEEGETDE